MSIWPTPDEPSDPDIESISETRSLTHAHPKLVSAYRKIKAEYEEKFPNRELCISCTYRSPEKQHKLFLQGRFGNPGKIITNCDGTRKVSRHNAYPAEAIDCYVLVSGKVDWDEEAFWPLLPLAIKYGITSGGSWSKFPDWCHLELPR